MKAASISWVASAGVGVATAVVGLLVGGWLANRAVTWYHVPSRDGGAGYFVVFQALFVAVAGLAIGIVASRYVGHFMDVTFLRALASAQLVMLLLLGTIGGIARLFADVPPEISGQKLLLAVELSWQTADLPVLDAGDSRAYLKLASTVGRGVNYPRDGALWLDHTRHEGTRAIVPGAVEIYTSRGKRRLRVMNGGSAAADIQVPLDASPKKQTLAWSEWIPVNAAATGNDARSLQYRFRVVPRDQPVRVDTVGPFTVEMMVKSFAFQQFQNEPRRLNADATYNVLYRGKPIPRAARRIGGAPVGANANPSPVAFTEINSIAVVGGNAPALFAKLDGRYGAGGYGLIKEENGAAVTEYAGAGMFRIFTHRLTVDAKGTTAPAITFKALDGAFDRVALSEPGLYVFPEAVLDTRTLAVRAIPAEQNHTDLRFVAPVSLSPDASAFARMGGDEGRPVLREVSLVTGESRDVPLTTAPVDNGSWSSVSRSWFDHYFEWKSAGTSSSHIVLRPNALAMVRRGLLTQEPGYRQYDLSPVDSAMRDVVEQFLMQELGAKSKPGTADEYTHTFMVEGSPLYVVQSDNRVSVHMDRNSNTLPLGTFATKFDKALATRRYDAHFQSGQPD
ncbi:MAG: hypothetical protein H7Z40_15745 [Phycisphaerae bacterium]|nr:hypothetical protein [Gemmatimonadaceae bacterium]